MKTVRPHEFFYLDFEQILEEGKRQEDIHPSNQGELSLTAEIHAYFADEVLPMVIQNDWVFDAASEFAAEYVFDCFQSLRLGGHEVFKTQKNLLVVKEKVVDLLARAHIAGAAPAALSTNLTKASDFLQLVNLQDLNSKMRREALELHRRAQDHEELQLTVTLRAIRDNYEISLPRVMYVIRRVIKVAANLPRKPSDNGLTSISEYLDWYESHIDSEHALYPVLGNLRAFYKVARNVASHHEGLEWNPQRDEVTLRDDKSTVTIHVDKFIQAYRHLTYICEFGVRGLLAAFCEREQGPVSNSLVREYIKTFPEKFPESEQGTVRFYPA